MSILRRLLGDRRSAASTTSVAPTASAAPTTYSLPPAHPFDVPRGAHFAVHGESYRQTAIRELRARCKPHPTERGRLTCDVTLVAEPANPYDQNAVAVHSSCGHVGYLPRDAAPDFAELLAEARTLGYDGVRCGAIITGGEPGRESLGVVLLLSYPDVCLDDLRRAHVGRSTPT